MEHAGFGAYLRPKRLKGKVQPGVGQQHGLSKELLRGDEAALPEVVRAIVDLLIRGKIHA